MNRFIFWILTCICRNRLYVLFVKLHEEILTCITSFINKHLIVHQITQQPLLKCVTLDNNSGLRYIRVAEVDLTTLKTHKEMYKVIHVLRSGSWIWTTLICAPIVRFVIPVRNDNVKKFEVERIE